MSLFFPFSPPKALYAVHADHNNVYVVGGTAYYDRLKRFVDEVVR